MACEDWDAVHKFRLLGNVLRAGTEDADGAPKAVGNMRRTAQRGTYTALCTVAELLRLTQSAIVNVKAGRSRSRHCNRKVAVRSARQRGSVIDRPPGQVTELHFVRDVQHEQQVSLMKRARHSSK